jgi:hypothetical protein
MATAEEVEEERPERTPGPGRCVLRPGERSDETHSVAPRGEPNEPGGVSLQKSEPLRSTDEAGERGRRGPWGGKGEAFLGIRRRETCPGPRARVACTSTTYG